MATPTYDKTKARELLSIAQAHSNQPNGEFVLAMADQLIGAQVEIASALNVAAQAEKESNRVTTELESAQQTIVRLRSGSTGNTEMRAALTQIAKSPKGSQKLAAETLAAIDNPKPAEAAKA